MNVSVLTTQGKASEKKIELHDEVWGVPLNSDLVAQAIYVYRANLRKGTAHAKTRGEVRGGGIKPWKQKGTGRARQGSIRSPLWTKGGVAFPPRSYKKVLKLSDQMKHKALCCVLSERMKSGTVKVVSSFDAIEEGKTKEMEKLIENLGIKSGNTLFVARTEDNKQKVLLSCRNIQNVSVCVPGELNMLDAASAEYVVVTPESVKNLEERLLKKSE